MFAWARGAQEAAAEERGEASADDGGERGELSLLGGDAGQSPPGGTGRRCGLLDGRAALLAAAAAAALACICLASWAAAARARPPPSPERAERVTLQPNGAVSAYNADLLRGDPAQARATEDVGHDEGDEKEDFDCEKGYANWLAGWSDKKKMVCCTTELKGCEFDCEEGFDDDWEKGWSADKKTFCCENEQKGCAPEDPGGLGPAGLSEPEATNVSEPEPPRASTIHNPPEHEPLPSVKTHYSEEEAEEEEEEEEQPVIWSRVGEGMGCENWREVALGDWVRPPRNTAQHSADSCGNVCAQTPGCQAFGFQTMSCNGTEQAADGACFLWSGPCQMSANVCWDNYRMEQALPVKWSIVAQRTGCANNDTITVQHSLEWNPNACGIKCEQQVGCKAFTFQPSDCNGPDSDHRGACSLFSGDCERAPSSCKDYYLMKSRTLHLGDVPEDSASSAGGAGGASGAAAEGNVSEAFVVSPEQAPKAAAKASSETTVLLAADKGSVILRVNHVDRWSDGDKITIKKNGDEMNNVIASVRASAGTLLLEEPLPYNVPLKATVTKVSTGASGSDRPQGSITQKPTPALTKAPGSATTSVTEDAAAGSYAVKVDDTSVWNLEDMIQISVDPDSPQSETMFNLIETIDEGTQTLELMYTLSGAVPAGSRITLAPASTSAGRY